METVSTTKKIASAQSPILIVEDDKDFVRLLEDILAARKYPTVQTVSVADAIRKQKNQKYLCILLDLHLEDGTGEQVLTEVRKHPKGRNVNTPVIIISGHVMKDVIERVRGKVQGILVKPFEPSLLLEMIEKQIQA